MNSRVRMTRRVFLSGSLQMGVVLHIPSEGATIGWGPGNAHSSPTNKVDCLQQSFVRPPRFARPWVYWIWLNGSITREGITADLEAMEKAGIGGALIQTCEAGRYGPVRFMSGEWRECIHYALDEANRVGLQIQLPISDGYDCGGPWVRPEHAMKKLAWTETSLQGPEHFKDALPQPPATLGFYRDVAVLAFNTLPSETLPLQTPKVTVTRGKPSFIQQDFAAPLTARGISVFCVSRDGFSSAEPWELQVSEDGQRFHTVERFQLGGLFIPRTLPISPVKAKHFRLIAPAEAALDDSLFPAFTEGYRQAGFKLHASTPIDLWEQKGGFVDPQFLSPIGFHSAGRVEEPSPAVGSEGIIDLTSHIDEDDRLDWQFPPGYWTVLRIGYVPTGRRTSTATEEGEGLVVDTFSRAGVESHFPYMMRRLLEDSSALINKSLTAFHSQSWECGAQNWTPGFQDEFRRRRGYDMTAFLPVIAGGRLVESREVSERFLWDFRRTIADLIAENFWGRMTQLCHEQGVQTSFQASGSQAQFMNDPLLFQSKSDMPMTEFWFNGSMEELWPECKFVPSAAHVYGRKLVAAEAFTSGYTAYPSGEWREHPYLLKGMGDRAFCSGINRFVMMRWVHQPDLDARPGIKFGGQALDPADPERSVEIGVIGTNFDRTQTWWPAGAAWTRYLARCQYLLEEGSYVADLCVLMSEGVPNTLEWPKNLQPGYGFDCINQDVVFKSAVIEGALTTPSGMRYRVLVLPDTSQMTPGLARDLKRLTNSGLVVVGPKPNASPSLSDYPHCDAEVREIATALWDSGKVVNKPLPEVLPALGLTPDFEFSSSRQDAELRFIHRRIADADVYFVANQRERFEEIRCTFRIGDRVPEVWDADSGRIFTSGVYQQVGGRTTLPLLFEPYGAWFVVFREPSKGEPIVAVTKDSREVPHSPQGFGEHLEGVELTRAKDGALLFIAARPGHYELKTASDQFKVQVPVLPAINMTGPWHIHFPAQGAGPSRISVDSLTSWTEFNDEHIRYFSGTATYANEFDVPASLLEEDRAIYLDLGKVEIMAQISVNGSDLGVQWKPPYRVEISSALRPGRNCLTIKVTNLWVNRLIGDSALTESHRYTRTDWNPFTPDSPLLQSGLLGPVAICSACRMYIRRKARH